MKKFNLKVMNFWREDGYYDFREAASNTGYIIASHDKFINSAKVKRIGYVQGENIIYFLDEKEYSEAEMLRLIKLKAFL